jgi:hypothetical protein
MVEAATGKEPEHPPDNFEYANPCAPPPFCHCSSMRFPHGIVEEQPCTGRGKNMTRSSGRSDINPRGVGTNAEAEHHGTDR